MKSMLPDKLIKGLDSIRSNQKTRQGLQILLELILIALWAFWVGREYLDFSSNVVPAGREFGSAIQTHHLWTRFRACGWCALWNGSAQGGYPAFAETYGSVLHPVIMITTLIWGVLNGSKLALVIGLWIAGCAQWWIARELRLSWLPRLWSAGMAVVGGHLSGRMELGVFGVFLATATTSLIYAAILAVARRDGWKATVVLAIVAALSLLAGQGYMQIGLLGLLPALVVLLSDKGFRFRQVWKKYLVAAVLAVFLTAPFLVPFLHFSPNFVKHTDPQFDSAQPIAYIPLNLVIDDVDYYRSEMLSKLAYPYMNTLYIGWIPVLFALVGLMSLREEERKYFWFFGVSIAMTLLLSSATVFKWAVTFLPKVAGVRYPTIIAGLIVPPILGIAAYGLDYLFSISWPKIWLGMSEAEKPIGRSLSLKSLLLIPLIFSLYKGYQFSQLWIYTDKRDEVVEPVIEALRTDSIQWVSPPFGEHHYIEPAIAAGLKVSPGIMPWGWKDRDSPAPFLEASHSGPPAGSVELVEMVADVGIYEHMDEFYAAVVNDQETEICHANGNSGRIDVECDVPFAGSLIVKENTYAGWKAWRDGKRVALKGEQWLQVDVPEGKHQYQFRYRPWDVPLGLALSALGMAACVWLWFSPPQERADETEMDNVVSS
mgnify:CR=1 FL=1